MRRRWCRRQRKAPLTLPGHIGEALKSLFAVWNRVFSCVQWRKRASRSATSPLRRRSTRWWRAHQSRGIRVAVAELGENDSMALLRDVVAACDEAGGAARRREGSHPSARLSPKCSLSAIGLISIVTNSKSAVHGAKRIMRPDGKYRKEHAAVAKASDHFSSSAGRLDPHRIRTAEQSHREHTSQAHHGYQERGQGRADFGVRFGASATGWPEPSTDDSEAGCRNCKPRRFVGRVGRQGE